LLRPCKRLTLCIEENTARAIDDPGYEYGIEQHPLGSENAVCAGELEKRYLATSKRKGEISPKFARNTEPLGVLNHRIDPDSGNDIGGNEVTRFFERYPQRDRPKKLFIKIRWGPILIPNPKRARSVVDDRRGRIFVPIDRRKIENRFKRRAGLTKRLGRPIKLAPRIAVPTHKADYPPGVWIDEYHRTFNFRCLVEEHILEDRWSSGILGSCRALLSTQRDLDDIANSDRFLKRDPRNLLIFREPLFSPRCLFEIDHGGSAPKVN